MFSSPNIRLARRRRQRADDVLIALAAAGRADVDALSRATKIQRSRVVQIVEGGLPEYRPAYSYLAQGLARRYAGEIRTYAVTPKGAKVARAVLAQRRLAGHRAQLAGVPRGGKTGGTR